MLYFILSCLVVGAMIRYFPGVKCLTYCKYKTYRYDKACLRLYCLFYESDTKNMVAPDFDNINKRQLISLYEDSTPFGCANLEQEEWHTTARDFLKSAIADKELLED